MKSQESITIVVEEDSQHLCHLCEDQDPEIE